VDFHAEEVVLRFGLGHAPGGAAVAEADFQDYRRGVAEHFRKVEWAPTVAYAPARPQLIQRPFLPVREAPAAQHVTAHGAAHSGPVGGAFIVREGWAHDGFIVASGT
jgi:hypothetical protein